MKTRAVVLSFVLSCAGWVLAQNSAPANPNPGNPPANSQTNANQSTASPQSTAPAQGASPAQSTTPANPAPNSQTDPYQQPTDQRTNATNMEAGSNPSTLRGCLSGSAATGSYILTDETSKVYTLAGNFDALRMHVGEEVEVTGQPTATSGPTSGAAASGSTAANAPASSGAAEAANGANTSAKAGMGKLFQVTGVNKVGDHCKQPGSSPGADRQVSRTYELAAVYGAEQASAGAGSGATGQGGAAGS